VQVVLVYVTWFRRNSLLQCVSQPEIAKNSLKPPILGVQASVSFKVIDVGTTGKLVSNVVLSWTDYVFIWTLSF